MASDNDDRMKEKYNERNKAKLKNKKEGKYSDGNHDSDEAYGETETEQTRR